MGPFQVRPFHLTRFGCNWHGELEDELELRLGAVNYLSLLTLAQNIVDNYSRWGITTAAISSYNKTLVWRKLQVIDLIDK